LPQRVAATLSETSPTVESIASMATTLPNEAIPDNTVSPNRSAKAVGGPLRDGLSSMQHYPMADTFAYQGRSFQTEYATDSLLQARVQYYMRHFHPESGALLVGDLHSGRLMAASENQGDTLRQGLNLSFRSGFPAASLIKIITATAGLEGPLSGPTDSLQQLGANHTLYRYQIKVDERRTCPKIELREAFARSVNPAFAVLGLRLGHEALQKAAERFGFNSEQNCVRWEKSIFSAPDTGFHLAEVACGFTPASTLSPLHALQIARALGDDGRLLNPVFTTALIDLKSGERHLAPYSPENTTTVASPTTLISMRDLMGETTRVGTARKGFHRAMRAEELNQLDLGGKTGSLDGMDPPGRYEWFIGYARMKENPDQGIAVAVMLINEHYLAVHASELAAYVVKDWLRNKIREARKARGGAV
jgi:cell division protein FtsI/penicillin-binding protein 2